MADVAVPSDGGERLVDVLSVARRTIAVAAVLACVACGESGAPDGGSGSAGGDGEATAGVPAAQAQALLGAIAERLAEAGAGARPAEPRWPQDLRFHPETRIESVELMALLEDEAGRPYSFTRRFERLSLAARAAAAERAGGEDFAFDAIVRLGGATRVGEAGEADPDEAADGLRPRGTTLEVRTAIERVTLGLAESGEQLLAVRDARLERSPPTDRAAEGARCASEQRLREGESVALRFVATACPSAVRIGSLVLATSPTLAVDGSLVVEGQARAVVGRGWVRQVWGETLPSPGGAVLFDRLLLDVDGVGLIEAERSKRRSGRGPRTTTARLRRGPDGEEVSAEWRDLAVEGSAAGEAGEVPAAWRFSVESLGIDLTLIPPAGGRTVGATGEPAWRGAVRAEGSHAGAGFVEFVPLDPPPPDEETRS